jgi:hypothetical protein
MIIYNAGTVNVGIGKSTLVLGQGMTLLPGEKIPIEFESTATPVAIYGMAVSGTCEARILEW